MSTWRTEGDGADPKKIGDLLGGVGKRLGAPKVVATSAVMGRWEELVGRAVADHATPVSVHGGTLLVEVTDPAWATQMKFLAGDVVTRIGEVLGDGLVDHMDVRVARPKRPPNNA